MLLDGRMHGVEALGKGRTTEAVQAIVRRYNFDDDQARSGRLGENGLDVFNGNGHEVSLLLVVGENQGVFCTPARVFVKGHAVLVGAGGDG